MWVLCHHCGYVWQTASMLTWVTCPSCIRKTERDKEGVLILPDLGENEPPIEELRKTYPLIVVLDHAGGVEEIIKTEEMKK